MYLPKLNKFKLTIFKLYKTLVSRVTLHYRLRYSLMFCIYNYITITNIKKGFTL